ncbi:hypothetical protein [Shewanella glacialipiscicola]|uniref:hypothetical protein n=1 Tax=Shewanella glacialipiscicola TaxID=614069 RepID=UPI003D7B396C
MSNLEIDLLKRIHIGKFRKESVVEPTDVTTLKSLMERGLVKAVDASWSRKTEYLNPELTCWGFDFINEIK